MLNDSYAELQINIYRLSLRLLHIFQPYVHIFLKFSPIGKIQDFENFNFQICLANDSIEWNDFRNSFSQSFSSKLRIFLVHKISFLLLHFINTPEVQKPQLKQWMAWWMGNHFLKQEYSRMITKFSKLWRWGN